MKTHAKNTPLLASTHLPGVVTGTTIEELLNALETGSKRMIFGQYITEMSRMLPIPNTSDILQLVAEARMLHGSTIAGHIAQTINRRVDLAESQKPALRLVLAELLQNSIEHGNLGLHLIRHDQVNETEWFDKYQETLRATLASPVGRIPVRISCLEIDNVLHIEIEDRGMGFPVRQTLDKAQSPDSPTGRGLTLVMKLLKGMITYAAGGRIVRIAMPLERDSKSVQNSQTGLRHSSHIIIKASQPTRVPVLERIMRSLGCQQTEILTSESTLVEKGSKASLIVLDADTTNFAPIAYTLGNIRKKWQDKNIAQQTPVIIFSPRAQSAACNLVLQYPKTDVISAQSSTDEMVLRIERMLEQHSSHAELNTITLQQQQEVERTRNFQHHMMPKAARITELAKQHTLQVATSYQGCETLAGDYWTMLELNDHLIAFAVVDFTGHGVMAALNTVQLHALLERESALDNPKIVAENLNTHLHHLLGAGSFASYVYGVLNTQTGELEYASGGAPPMMLKSAKGHVKEIPCNGIPLGLSENITITTRKYELDARDTLILVSDAITDAPHQNGERWGSAGLARELGRITGNGARNILNQLMGTYHTSVRRPIPDDITVVALTWKNG